MRKKKFKRVGALALSLVMIWGMMPGIAGPIEVQAANSAPEATYWTDLAGLKSYNLSTSGSIGKIRFGLNGSASREWAICGTDTNGSLALLSTTAFGTAAYGSYSNYSASDFVGKADAEGSDYLSSTYFSTGELAMMQTVGVKTLESNQSGTRDEDGSTVTSKLYLPDAASRESAGTTSIFVGTNNNIEIDVANKLKSENGFQTNLFWLRSPGDANGSGALVAFPGRIVRSDLVSFNIVSVVPALNLNLSSDIFASAADAASSTYTGDNANSTMTANTYTIRYASTGSETAVISADGTSVAVKDANEKYLMVQNSDGACAVAIDSADKTINVSEVTIGGNSLTDFDYCKVWIESTDDNRITTAKVATQATGFAVSITPGSNMTKTAASGVATQTGLTGAMTSVVYTANEGYYFPTTYSVNTVNDIGVNRDSFTQITVSGTPTATATITLDDATAKENQSAPSVSDGVDKIVGTTTAMEYILKTTFDGNNTATWSSCTASNTTVAAGTYYVRYAGTDTLLAGEKTTVIVTASPNPPTLYQVTVNNGTGDGSYVKDASVTIKADAAPSGQHFKEWTGADSLTFTSGSKTSATATFTMPASTVNVTAIYENDTPTPDPDPTPDPTPTTPTYKIIEGAGATWTTGADGTLSIRGEGAYSKFKEVKVDGTVVAASNYSVTEGSTIITFKADYLKTLSVGNHMFELVWTDGSATTSFTIKEAATNAPSHKDDVPKTGDTTPIVWLFILAVISGTGILYFGRKRKTVR